MAIAAHSSSARRHDFDFLRVAAMFAVITIHCVMPITIILTPASSDWAIAEVIDSYMRWCVPVFVMISGALLIRKSTYTQLGTYIHRRISRILIPFIAWPILYALWLLAFGKDVTWQVFWHGILSGQPVGGSQLYFLFIITGLYILNPFISLLVSNVSRRTFFYLSLAALAAASLWHTIANTMPGLDETYSMFTWCLPFIGYFMLGHVLRDTWLTSRQALVALIGFFLLGMTNAILTVGTRIDNDFFFQSYISPTVIGLSICAFLGGRALYGLLVVLLTGTVWHPRLQRALARLAAVSFGIYLVHLMILDTIVFCFALSQSSLTTALILFIVVPPLSYAIVSILLKIPGLRRLVV